ncbi:unnamed protein product, partial [Rotaria sp. Silwood1]
YCYIDPSNKDVKYYSKVALSWICGVEHQGEDDNKAAVVPPMPPVAPESLFWKHIFTITVSLLTRPIPEQCLHGLNVFDLNNPVKPTPIPTKQGRWHKADTAFEDKHIQPISPTRKLSRVESAAAIRKFGLFYPDPSNKDVKYYSKVALSWICGVEHQGEDD